MTPTAVNINTQQDKNGDWTATVYGFSSTKYFYAGSLAAVLLKVVANVEGNAEYGKRPAPSSAATGERG